LRKDLIKLCLGLLKAKEKILQISSEYPQEHLIELLGLSPSFVGRITLFRQTNGNIDAEIDIVQTESGKIYSHVRSLYNHTDARDLLDLCVHYLKKFLDSKKH
jgi:hypothetical protein